MVADSWFFDILFYSMIESFEITIVTIYSIWYMVLNMIYKIYWIYICKQYWFRWVSTKWVNNLHQRNYWKKYWKEDQEMPEENFRILQWYLQVLDQCYFLLMSLKKNRIQVCQFHHRNLLVAQIWYYRHTVQVSPNNQFVARRNLKFWFKKSW